MLFALCEEIWKYLEEFSVCLQLITKECQKRHNGGNDAKHIFEQMRNKKRKAFGWLLLKLSSLVSIKVLFDNLIIRKPFFEYLNEIKVCFRKCCNILFILVMKLAKPYSTFYPSCFNQNISKVIKVMSAYFLSFNGDLFGTPITNFKIFPWSSLQIE